MADNGSTDGTLDDLQRNTRLRVFSLEERLSWFASTQNPLSTAEARADFARHGSTLDWLAALVQTPYFVTLDSDVEFLRDGWLSEMLSLLQDENLDAVGEYEPGFPLAGGPDGTGYRPRLAPHLLLLRTAAFRPIHASFRGFCYTRTEEETRRWLAISDRRCLTPADLEGFRTLTIFDTGAYLFERLRGTGLRWMSTPDSIRLSAYKHLGHMSTVPADSARNPRREDFLAAHADRMAYVAERLRLYEVAT